MKILSILSKTHSTDTSAQMGQWSETSSGRATPQCSILNPRTKIQSACIFKTVVRHVAVPVDEKFKSQLSGPVTVQYVETYNDGAQKLAETHAVLR